MIINLFDFVAKLGRLYIHPEKRRKLKPTYNRVRKKISAVYSYSYSELVQSLKTVGIELGDVLMVHSSFNPYNGFQGKPHDVIKAIKEVSGDKEGTILMPSLAYGGATYKYLSQIKVFDVKRTVSRMGLISEIFRRQKDVVRSLHPTHPILASGKLAQWFVQNHESCLYGCGPRSPFDKLGQKNGKVLFFDTGFAFTYIHYIEHLIKDELPFPLYTDESYKIKVIDEKGKELTVITKAYSIETVKRRRANILFKKMLDAKMVKKLRIGMTNLILVNVEDAMLCVKDMIRKGEFFYEFE
jgi:aminoglycoside 3-N-acetyltransferase